MKENELIKDLSGNLKPFKTTEGLLSYLLKWSSYTFFIFILCYLFLPTRADIVTQSETIRFHTENFLWMTTALSSGIAFYYSCFPQRMKVMTWLLPVLNISILLLIVLSVFSFSTAASDMQEELNFMRGRCGFITFLISAIHSTFLGRWAKKAAPRNESLTGFWAALSGSSIGCLFMQVVCEHHSASHLLLWHFLPLAIICFLGQWAGRNLLKW